MVNFVGVCLRDSMGSLERDVREGGTPNSHRQWKQLVLGRLAACVGGPGNLPDATGEISPFPGKRRPLDGGGIGINGPRSPVLTSEDELSSLVWS